MEPAILVVESEGVLMHVLSLLKESLHLQLHSARDALQAITLVQRHTYETLVIDGGLAYIDGWALLRYLEDNVQQLSPIIVRPEPDAQIEFAREFAGRVECVPLSDLRQAVENRLSSGA